MIKPILPLLALLALGGCAYQTEAQINAALSRHVGESETDLVRELGVPTRSFDSGGHRFLAYYKGEQEVQSDGGFGGGFGYGRFGYGGFGGFGGYGGFGGWGWDGFGGYSTIYAHGCDTTYEVIDHHVASFARHGDAC